MATKDEAVQFTVNAPVKTGLYGEGGELLAILFMPEGMFENIEVVLWRAGAPVSFVARDVTEEYIDAIYSIDLPSTVSFGDAGKPVQMTLLFDESEIDNYCVTLKGGRA